MTIGHRTGSRVPSFRQRFAANHGCSQAKQGMARPGNSAESPTNRCSRQGRARSAASANILCRALSSNSYEGWPRARRMIRVTRPGTAQLQTLRPPTVRPTPAASWQSSVEGQHRYGPCGVGPEQPRRQPAPSQVTRERCGPPRPCRTLRPPDQLAAMLRLVTTPRLLDSSIAGNGSSICPSIPGRGWINRSLGSYEPILRAVLGIQLGGPVSTRCQCTASAGLGDLGTAELRRHVTRTRSPRRRVSTLRAVPQSRWYPAVSADLLHPRGELRARRVAVPKLRMHDQLGLAQ